MIGLDVDVGVVEGVVVSVDNGLVVKVVTIVEVVVVIDVEVVVDVVVVVDIVVDVVVVGAF